MSHYSPQIVEHFTNPRNPGKMPHADIDAEVRNPVCGDQIHIFARLENERIAECSFLAYGCAAALGTASILTEAMKGRMIGELAEIQEADVVKLVGGLTPTQRHCAQLAREVLVSLARAYRNRSEMDTLAGRSPVLGAVVVPVASGDT